MMSTQTGSVLKSSSRSRRALVEAILERQKTSGRSLRQLALEEGIPLSTVEHWRKRLKGERSEGGSKRSSKFVRLRVSGDSLDSGGEKGAYPYEVVLRSGYRLRVSAGFERHDLRGLLGVLEDLC